MPEVEPKVIITPPTYRAMETCYHQDEGVIVITDYGETYSFVPKQTIERGTDFRKYLGLAYLIRDDQFGKAQKAELLILHDGTEAHDAELFLFEQG